MPRTDGQGKFYLRRNGRNLFVKDFSEIIFL